jgi:hypothetical protein
MKKELVSRSFGRCVAVAAVDAVVRDVVLVAEGDGLAASDAGFGDVRRAPDSDGDPCKTGEDEVRTVDAQPGYRVGATVKGQVHRVRFPFRPSRRDETL